MAAGWAGPHRAQDAGGGRRGSAFYGEDMPLRGQDAEADIMVTLEEALHGSTRQISFTRGRAGKVETYTVKIPKGVREGQRTIDSRVGEMARKYNLNASQQESLKQWFRQKARRVQEG